MKSTSGSSASQKEFLQSLYKRSPADYALDVLGVHWWLKQAEIARAVATHRKTFVRASNSVGKTHVAAGLVNWFFDTRQPAIVLTTAPTEAQVKDVLWKEVRVQRKGRPGLMPKSPRMETTPDHFAKGYTAREASAFQGSHEAAMLIVFDEATAIDKTFWEAAEGMLTGDRETHWLCILNPTDTTSHAHAAEQSGEWHVITVNAMEHPNIAAQLSGRPAPYPAAVTLGWLLERITAWCDPISATDAKSADIEFPPNSGNHYRPGPLFEGRVLGRWPSQAATAIWTEAMWQRSITARPLPQLQLEIGCDVARHGDDYTSILVRRGPCALWHETHNGWPTGQTAGRLKELAKKFAQRGESPVHVPIKIDDDGVGGGVTDQANGFRFVGLSSASKAIQAEDYPNRRSELWFAAAARADDGNLDISRLPQASLALLRAQLLAPKWRVDSQGRRVVEPKDDTKKRIGRSPDDADALNLAYAPAPAHHAAAVGGTRTAASAHITNSPPAGLRY